MVRRVLTNKEFYKKVANQYTELLSTYTAEGQCYRVDLRLRPDGTLGEIAVSDEGARTYYSDRARDWEKQMLIKARVSAGESEPGASLLEFVEPLIYQSSLDFRAVEAVSETRQRISEKLAAKRGAPGGLDIKLTPGGIRDIEFLVQCLQRLHGGREQWVRHGGTVIALFRLRDKGFLSDGEYARLAAAYSFLRYLEHRLQMEEDRQTHTLPNGAGASGPAGAQDAGGRQRRPAGRRGAPAAPRGTPGRRARDLRSRGARLPATAGARAVERARAAPRGAWKYCRPTVTSSASSVSVRRASPPRSPPPTCVAAASASNISWKKRCANPELLARLEASPEGVLDIFEHSPHFADQLLRYPELLDEIGEPSPTRGRARCRMAPRCAASTAARCSAYSAKACWAAPPSSRPSARPAYWPTA